MHTPQWTRRRALQGGALAAGAGLLGGTLGSPLTASAAVAPPTIHNRAAWNAREPQGSLTINNYRPTFIVVHHTATANTGDTSLEHAYSFTRSRQNYHMDGRGYSDVGDHFGISRGGHITEARKHSLPLLTEGGTRFVHGAHAAGGNAQSIGIENEGTYIDAAPPAALYNALVHLCAYICQQYRIPANSSGIIGHRQVTATQCPGDLFFGMLGQLRTDVAALLGDDAPPPPPPPPTTWPSVSRGAYGEAVRSIQYFLSAHGISTGVDGDFGPQTESAVVAFQSTNGLASDGVVGPQTWPVLVIMTQQGSNGHAVRAVQSQLSHHAIPTTVDGVFGPQTDAAVRQFQSARGLAVDGQAGPQTWRAFVS